MAATYPAVLSVINFNGKICTENRSANCQLFQLYDTQVLKKYNIWLNELQKSTASTLNAVAVALLNKVNLLCLVP